MRSEGDGEWKEAAVSNHTISWLLWEERLNVTWGREEKR